MADRKEVDAAPLQLWGGVECTVNRIGDTYRDQTVISGHQDRIDDLHAFAALGIRRLRYPVLWERVAPDHPDSHDWRWSDERIAEIQRLGMEPIIGLLHHGSGPAYTSLVSDNFAELLGDYAGAVAARYPHVMDWTPVNEPLTTARFSALYGHWYPHACDESLFWQAVLNQIDGTRAAMRAIRRTNPAARLIQTEDLGQCYATETLGHVADHYNDRRWMTWDLLTGRVEPNHALWSRLNDLGFGDRLRAIADDPCPPDILGVNHYITSDRFLDDRLVADGAEGFLDLAAARVLDPAPSGLRGVLREAWDRYDIPIALTECQLGCTRGEQVRWLGTAWQDCLDLRADGVDIRALTIWALLGATDWNSLLTQDVGHYEPGAFDVRSGRPRLTAVGALAKSLAHATPPPPAVAALLPGSGWWQRDVRLEHAPYQSGKAWIAPPPGSAVRPLLITGATGTLGQMLAGTCAARGLEHVLLDRAGLPLDDPHGIAAALDHYEPWAVINAAGWVRVDDAEDEPHDCLQANSEGAGALARACAERDVHCTLFSSDLVFDGTNGPYAEHDDPSPLNVYGHSKAAAERHAAAIDGPIMVVRTAAFFSPHDPHNFAAAVERTLRAGKPFLASAEHIVTPTYLPDLAHSCLDLVVDGADGIWHLTSGAALSWYDFARRIADALGLDRDLIRPATPEMLGWRASRPRNAALVSDKGGWLPHLDDAITRYAGETR